jgi:hypothetical protein
LEGILGDALQEVPQTIIFHAHDLALSIPQSLDVGMFVIRDGIAELSAYVGETSTRAYYGKRNLTVLSS